MKKNILFMALSAWALLMPMSCSEAGGGNGSEEPAGELITPVLTVDKEMVVYNDETVGYSYAMFSWKNASTGSMVPEYTLQVTKESDKSFADAESFSCNRLNLPVSVAEMKSAANASGEDFSVVARLTASADGKSMTSNTVKVKVSKIRNGNLPALYVIGAATPGGWDLSKAEKMAAFNNTYSCEIDLLRNEDFKFVTQNTAWWPGLVNASSDPLVYRPVYIQEQLDEADDLKFRVEVSGKYSLTVDASDLDAITMEAVLLEAKKTETIYMAGEATGFGYDRGSTEARLLKPVENQDDVYRWTGRLEGGKDFKFLASEIEWVPSYNRDAKASSYWTMVRRVSYDEPDEKFQVKETGTYVVTINTRTLTVSCEIQQ